MVQVPCEQPVPTGHACPHTPQFALLDCRSTQVALMADGVQSTRFTGHSARAGAHTPPRQRSGHACPHEPQFWRSVVRSTHTVVPPDAQVVLPDVQVPAQKPFAQVVPDGHARPQRPQLSALVLRFAQKGVLAV